MMLRRIRSRRRASITSLIDVIFLLLLFFMLASTFSKFSEIELATTVGAGGGGQDVPGVIRLQIEPDRLMLDDAPVGLSHALAQLTEAGRDGEVVAIVSVSASVTTQRLTDILTFLGNVPGLTLHIVEPE